MTNVFDLAKKLPVGVKRILPVRAKEKMKGPLVELVRCYRRLDGQLHGLPDFVIAGAQKCGTTTLYTQLSAHPGVLPALQKEINYFNIYYDKGSDWYRANFPAQSRNRTPSVPVTAQPVSGEATPGYMFSAAAFERMAQDIPEVKIIMMLRNPIDRTYSSYFHQVRKGRETLPFEGAIDAEQARLASDLEKMAADRTYYGPNYRYFSYLSRSIYAPQIRRCMKYFPPTQIMIINSEEFFRENRNVYRRVLDFLGLPDFDLSSYLNVNKKQYQPIKPETRTRLVDFFRPHNQELYELIGETYDWDH